MHERGEEVISTNGNRDASPATAPEQTAGAPTSNLKETFESIIVAFVLALIFRAFIVEAFVIPTGSMATTLLGAHMRFRCPDCGYQFDVNYSSPRESDNEDDVTIESPAPLRFDVHCPNCGYLIASPNHVSGFSANGGAVYSAPPVFPVDLGDRILVLKYAYLLKGPQRWDVVVFKAPPDQPANGPQFQTNYIKRLVGLPGETLEVLDGDVFISKDGGQTFTIQTRPREAQDAMWRIVYDNDHYPQLLPRAAGNEAPWQQPWSELSGGSGWNVGADAATGRVFHFNNMAGSSTIRFNPKAVSTSQTLTDYLVYDTHEKGRRAGFAGSPDDDSRDTNTVSDVKLTLNYRRTDGNGPLRLQLTKIDDIFTAEILPNQITVYHDSPAVAHSIIGQPIRFDGSPGKSHTIDFINVDYRVSLRVDGQELISSTPANYAPDFDFLLSAWRLRKQLPEPRIEIQADKQWSDVSHVSLWRDTYYTNQSVGGSRLLWGVPDSPAILKPDEYFVMGDNSPISADARCWGAGVQLPHEDLDVDAGRVPARFLLGRAFFVYWPAGFRLFGDSGYSLVPNFGEMRFIH
jgi:signal peptidase I